MALACLIVFLLVFFPSASASAFQSSIAPSKVKPGDTFVVRVLEVKNSETPSAFLQEYQIPLSSCGENCFIGIGAVPVNTKPGRYEVNISVGEKNEILGLSVVPARFPKRSLTLPRKKVFLSPEDLERVAREDEKLKLLWQQETVRLWEGNFILPLENSITTAFGVKRVLNREKTSVHSGVDLKGKEGDEIKASNRGKVILAEELFFGGYTVILDHGQGIYTTYMHLSRFDVRCGEIVSKGDIIGRVGSSGRSSGPHLHFGVRVMQTSANPVSLVKLKL